MTFASQVPYDPVNWLEQLYVGSENAVRNIASEVVRTCARRQPQPIAIELPVASLAVRLLSLDASNGLQLDERYTRAHLETFIGRCVERIARSDRTVFAQTLHMQWFINSNPMSRTRFIAQINWQQQRHAGRSQRLWTEIRTMRCEQPAERERLLRKICADVIISCRLGNVQCADLLAEVLVALRSVMQPDYVQLFAEADEETRSERLAEVRATVAGVLVYNKDCGFAGKEIVEVRDLLAESLALTGERLAATAQRLRARTDLLSTVLWLKERGELTREMEVTSDDGVGRSHVVRVEAEVDVERLQSVLMLERQHEASVRQFQYVADRVREMHALELKNYGGKLEQLRDLLHLKTAVPTEQVYPHFVELYAIRNELLKLNYVLREIADTNDELQRIAAAGVSDWQPYVHRLLDAAHRRCQSDRQRLKAAKCARIESTNPAVVVGGYRSTKMRLANGGFCTGALAEPDALLYLQPANTGIGVCTYAGQHYAFRSAQAARPFVADPELVLRAIRQRAREQPELVVLLGLFDAMYAARAERSDGRESLRRLLEADASGRLQAEEGAQPTHREMDVQTADGMVVADSGQHKDYVWNVWDYRRRAIQLANLMGCRTHAAQTAQSYGQWAAQTQTCSPRERGVQSKRNAAAQVRVQHRDEKWP